MIIEKLNEIQTKLKAPKSQYNSFGKYNYRNAEDILEATKPLLKETKCVLTISDDIVLIGDRYYIKATAILTCENGESISTSALAREDLDKKGMDCSQLTGSTSSYARKYALNGLFAIDDTKDADSLNDEPKKPQAKPSNTPKTPDLPFPDQTPNVNPNGGDNHQKMLELITGTNVTGSEVAQTIEETFGEKLKVKELSNAQFDLLYKVIKAKING